MRIFSKSFLSRAGATAALLTIFAALTQAVRTSEGTSSSAAADSAIVVVAVPWQGVESKAHQVYSGGSLVLQGVASAGGNGVPVALASGTWDPGDGTGPQVINVSNSRVLELTHQYTGADYTPYTAKLSVFDTQGNEYTDTFKVQVLPKSLEVEVNMAIDRALWFNHKAMQIGTAPLPAGPAQAGTQFAYYHPPYVYQAEVDSISAGLQVTRGGGPRGNGGALRNAGTDIVQWAAGPCDALSSDFYASHDDVVRNHYRWPVSSLIIDAKNCLNNITTGAFYTLHLSKWGQGGTAEFEYTRVTHEPPAGIPPTTAWWTDGDSVAATSSSVQALQVNGHRETGNPLQNPYVDDVARAMRYLQSRVERVSISSEGSYTFETTPAVIGAADAATVVSYTHEPYTYSSTGDAISPNVFITRGGGGALYNQGSDAVAFAKGTCEAMTSSFFDNHSSLVQQKYDYPRNVTILGTSNCLKNKTTGEFYTLTFSAWGISDGAFAYTRATNTLVTPASTTTYALESDTNGNGYGLQNLGHPEHTYVGGQIIDAFVATGTPNAIVTLGSEAGRTYKDVVQDLLDAYSWGQNEDAFGGWVYHWNDNSGIDSSSSAWWGVGKHAGEVWGAVVPEFVTQRNLRLGIPQLQSFDGTGTGNDGNCGYRGPNGNVANNGACLILMAADGMSRSDARYQATEKWLARNWATAYNSHYNIYNMYNLAKAMRTAVQDGQPAPITLIDGTIDWYGADPNPSNPTDLNNGYARFLVGTQDSSGALATFGGWVGGSLANAWGIMILSPSLFEQAPTAVCQMDATVVCAANTPPGTGCNTLGTSPYSTVVFDGSLSTPGDNPIAKYSWNFVDGSPVETSVTADHEFANVGTYGVRLTVSDTKNNSSSVVCQVNVTSSALPPVADAGGPYEVCVNRNPSVVLSGLGSLGRPSAIASYKWDFTEGDGINFSSIDAITATTDQTAYFTSLPAGTYNVGLRVTDATPSNEGGPFESTAYTTVTVRAANDAACNAGPTATANAYTTNKNRAVSGNVVTDGTADSDSNGDTFTAAVATAPATGSLTLGANGQFTYTPATDFEGTVTFTYTLTDEFGGTSAAATVTVEVLPIADSDGDGVLDPEDRFPNDPAETSDADGDGIGDNGDTDDDNDGTPDATDAFPHNPGESTDTDGDGTGNNADTDDDNDGVTDASDALPLDPTESVDTDGDGTGNNADADDDGDGTPDTTDAFPLNAAESTDTDGDGTGNNADTDDDGDGTPDTTDAFPLDATESTDTDGDGTGNNADADDDGDGTPDTTDAFPLDATESTDTDGDGTGNNADTDDDGDGTPDASDAFPLNPAESTDTDGDGTGNNADTDDDGDGTPDASDAFPLNPGETTDTDGDGTGNNADTDDDNDGVLDVNDAFPTTPGESTDTDGDGIGNNADTDDDNDGILDSEDPWPTTVTTVVQLTQDLVTMANGMSMSQSSNLLQSAITAGLSSTAGCNKLAAFGNQLSAQIGKKNGPTAAQGAVMQQRLALIRRLAGC